VAYDQVGGAFHEGSETGDAALAPQIEGDPGVHAALPEVAVQRRRKAVTLEQRAKLPKVLPQPRHRHRSVLPALPRILASGNARGGAQPRLADLPHHRGLLRALEELGAGRAPAATEARDQRFSAVPRLA
jgi:hypothetical protein